MPPLVRPNGPYIYRLFGSAAAVAIFVGLRRAESGGTWLADRRCPGAPAVPALAGRPAGPASYIVECRVLSSRLVRSAVSFKWSPVR